MSPGGASYLPGPGLGFGLEARGPPASLLARAALGSSRPQPLVYASPARPCGRLSRDPLRSVWGYFYFRLSSFMKTPHHSYS